MLSLSNTHGNKNLHTILTMDRNIGWAGGAGFGPFFESPLAPDMLIFTKNSLWKLSNFRKKSLPKLLCKNVEMTGRSDDS